MTSTRAIFLTSKLDLYDKNGDNIRIPKYFGNKNNILNNLKKYIKKYDNFLYIASDETNIEMTDMYYDANIKSFEITLPFKEYKILDIRTECNAERLINEADFIYLAGGHVPTQNTFFNKIKLKEMINNSNSVILGTSAGSMNCANNVYAMPELEGEAVDPKFSKYLLGLGLTDLNVIPHYNDLIGEELDGKNIMQDIIIPDSYKAKFYALNDGSYFLLNNSRIVLYGEAYRIENGNIYKICNEDEYITID